MIVGRYVSKFSRSLYVEYIEAKGIDIQSQVMQLALQLLTFNHPFALKAKSILCIYFLELTLQFSYHVGLFKITCEDHHLYRYMSSSALNSLVGLTVP